MSKRTNQFTERNASLTSRPPLSTRVVTAVAETLECETTELDPLYQYIDPDALDQLFAPHLDGTKRIGYVRFEMEGCQVVVESDRTVDVTLAE